MTFIRTNPIAMGAMRELEAALNKAMKPTLTKSRQLGVPQNPSYTMSLFGPNDSENSET